MDAETPSPPQSTATRQIARAAGVVMVGFVLSNLVGLVRRALEARTFGTSAVYDAFNAAMADVKNFGNLPIPLNVRNAPTKLMKELGYGKGYEKYAEESFLPEKIKKKKYFRGK